MYDFRSPQEVMQKHRKFNFISALFKTYTTILMFPLMPRILTILEVEVLTSGSFQDPLFFYKLTSFNVFSMFAEWWNEYFLHLHLT
jgi:hypothetical protein